jgi:hypothetical protein
LNSNLIESHVLPSGSYKVIYSNFDDPAAIFFDGYFNVLNEQDEIEIDTKVYLDTVYPFNIRHPNLLVTTCSPQGNFPTVTLTGDDYL